MGGIVITLATCLYFRDTERRNTNAPTLQLKYQISQQKTEDDEMYMKEDDYLQSPVSSHDNTNDTMTYYETDPNYLLLSDTDTAECCTVPSPIYPAVPGKMGQHRGLYFYDPAGERVR